MKIPFLRSFFALMRRNVIYRKRNIGGTIAEILLPVGFVCILVGIKAALEGSESFKPQTIPEDFPVKEDPVIPLTMVDYLQGFRARRTCNFTSYSEYDLNTKWRFEISNYFDNQNPFMKCDRRACKKPGEDARKYCEYLQLAVAPTNKGDVRATTRAYWFANWLMNEYSDINLVPEYSNGTFVRFFESSAAIDNYVSNVEYGAGENRKLAFAITFDEGEDDKDFVYTLRANSTNYNIPENVGRPAVLTHPKTKVIFDDFAASDKTCTPPGGAPNQGNLSNSCTGQYMYNGAITMQRVIGDWIHIITGAKNNSYYVAEQGMAFVNFPTKSYKVDGFYKTVNPFVPLLIALGLLYPVSAIIRGITTEKELKQKELMKMMSVAESDIGWSWFLSFWIFHNVTALCMSAGFNAFYPQSTFSYIWILWFLGWTAIISFSMFLASFFSRSTTATLVGLLVFFSGYFLTLAADFEFGNPTAIKAISLHPIAAVSYALQEIGRLEDGGVGLTANTYDFSNTLSGYNVGIAYRMLILDCFLWGFLAFYFNRVIAADFGQPLPWSFLCQLSYWRPEAAIYDDHYDEGDNRYADTPIEGVGDNLSQSIRDGRGVEIRNLRKVFGEKIAVDNLNLSMYSNQVTALLGHNGAGKTTTISMLTGMIKPTSGYALVDGKDIRTNMNEIRTSIGICLQHDCLFPQLTVQEHVEFFGRLKGMYEKYTKEEVAEKVRQSIEDVALLEKRDTWSKNLSGGMKRKLSVAIAFCGDSKTVLLDEPTSGMDPFSRRFTWNVIRQYRQDRCIILTTHFMDEADILGDRISIMAEGQLRCAGSALFLKKQYGVGYQLTIEKFPPKSSAAATKDGDDPNATSIDDVLTNIVMSAVDTATPLSNVGTELSFQLPIGAASQFTGMFESLDTKVDEKQIVTYGVSITTLDEVFLLVARGHDHGAPEKKLNSATADKVEVDPSKTIRSRMDLEKEGLFKRHITSLFRKRALNFKRDKKAWLCSTILPTLFVLVGFITFAIPDKSTNYRAMTLDDYNKNIKVDPINPVPINTDGNEFTCQPGSCIQRFTGSDPDVLRETGLLSDDDYTLCGVGFFALQRLTLNCTISQSEAIASHLGSTASPLVQEITDITLSSQALFNSSKELRASQYGALSMTHDLKSLIFAGTTEYRTSAPEFCSTFQARGTDYYPLDKCADYAGYGFVISYNYTALHVSLLFQALADQAILRNGTGDNGYQVRAGVQPLLLTQVEQDLTEEEASFSAWFLLVLSFPLISGTFGTFIVAEKANKAKHLQTVAGVQPSAYWLSSYMWDVMNYQLPCWITVVLMFAFNVETFITTQRDVLYGVLTSLVLFGPASAGFTYCFSFLFQSPSLCQLFVIIFNFFIGLGGPLVQFILRVIGDPSNSNSPALVSAANFIEWILRIFPSFNVGNALFKCLNIRSIEALAQKKITVWAPQAILWETILQGIWCVAYLLLAIQIDKWSTNPRAVLKWKKIVRYLCCRCCFREKKTGAATLKESAAVDDEDVIAENERVDSGEADNDLIILKHLTKVYDTGKVAVDNLSLGIPPGQCFGLLGINGAGKTTTMSMLTAEFPPSSGDATLGGFSVKNEPEKTRRRIGYCPQFDAHFQNMTGREHVQLYAAIKGVPPSEVESAVSSKLSEVGLSEFDSNRLSQGYSGGMKRKLSVACATIGQPQIVFLDEPSTGMDPVARRDMWAVISEMVSGGNMADEDRTSVILTTHAMEECEALCPKIGIMANGRLRCVGSAQHLKNRFGQGFQVEMKVEFVNQTDPDYLDTVAKLAEAAGKTVNLDHGEDGEGPVKGGPSEVSLNEDEALTALQAIDEKIADIFNPNDENGYAIYKNACSPAGCTLQELGTFAATELRMMVLEKFFEENFDGHILRERQDTKARYEVSSQGVRISGIFGKIEQNKEALSLADYGVSQTSLEQVFNMHAAEAERMKHEALKVGSTDG